MPSALRRTYQSSWVSVLVDVHASYGCSYVAYRHHANPGKPLQALENDRDYKSIVASTFVQLTPLIFDLFSHNYSTLTRVTTQRTRVANMDVAEFERGMSRASGVTVRFSTSDPVQASIAVGGSTPRLAVDVSQVRHVIPREGPSGKPAVEIVSDDIPGELVVVHGDIAFSPFREMYSEVHEGVSVVDDGLPFLVGWHDAYRYLDSVHDAVTTGDEDLLYGTLLRCLAYRWGAAMAGIAIWETDFDFRLNQYEHELIEDFGQANGVHALSDAGILTSDGRWTGTSLDMLLMNFRGADLSGCSLRGDFSGSDFAEANLRDSQLTDSILSFCNFEGADLRGADLTGSRITGARFTDPSAIATTTVDDEMICLGWNLTPLDDGGENRPPHTRTPTDDPESSSSNSDPGLISRVRTAIHAMKYRSQPGNWSITFDPSTDMFTVQRTDSTSKPSNATRFDESGKLEITGWARPSEEDRAGRETYVEHIRFSLESLCSHSDVRWVSDEVLHGWETLVVEAKNSNVVKTLNTGDNNLFTHNAARPPRQRPNLKVPESTTTIGGDEGSTSTVDNSSAFAELHHTFTGSGIDIPMVPIHLIDQLTHVKGDPVWLTAPELDLGVLYMFHTMATEDVNVMLSPDLGDF